MAPVIVRPVRKRVQARKISIIQPNQDVNNTTFLQVPTPSNIQPRSPTVVTFNLSDLSSPDDVFHTPMPPMSSSKDSGWLSRLDAVNSAVSDRHRRSAQRVDKTEAKAIKGPHRISTGGTCYLYAKKRRSVSVGSYIAKSKSRIPVRKVPLSNLAQIHKLELKEKELIDRRAKDAQDLHAVQVVLAQLRGKFNSTSSGHLQVPIETRINRLTPSELDREIEFFSSPTLRPPARRTSLTCQQVLFIRD